QFPVIPGRDVSGQVVELGPGAKLAVGDRVLGLVWNTYAEELVAPVEALAKLPEALDAQEAGALPLVVTTGAQLVQHAGVQEGWTVLVTGALGSVGRAAVYVCRQRGARVIAGVRQKDMAKAKELGADGVVAIDGGTGDAPQVDAILDTVGGEVIGKL